MGSEITFDQLKDSLGTKLQREVAARYGSVHDC